MVVRNGYIKEEDGGSMRMHKENSEKVCFLRGDHTHVYWLCADLYDSGIVVMDSHEVTIALYRYQA